MLSALALRSLVAGAYLLALLVNGSFDAVAAVLAPAILLIWAAPLIRDTIRRRHTELLKAPGAVPMKGA
jgi:hypothetical protein